MKKNNNTTKIFEIIHNSPCAISHAEISVLLKKSCNRVTVYRVLDKLYEQGKIHKIIDVTGVTKFASCDSCETGEHHHNHLHFSCTSCNQVTCLEENEPTISLPSAYIVDSVQLTISGICPNCHN